MSSNSSASAAGSSGRQFQVILPKKCVIDDFEISAFENEEQLNLFSLWQKVLLDGRRGIKPDGDKKPSQPAKTAKSHPSRPVKLGPQSGAKGPANVAASTKEAAGAPANNNPRIPVSRVPHHATHAAAAAAAAVAAAKVALQPNSAAQTTTTTGKTPARYPAHHLQRPPLGAPPGPRSDGLSHWTATLNQHQYKLNKLYNKYRGIQSRRNFVLERQRNAKIEQEIASSVLTPWTAYTALQALRLPELNITNQIFAPVTPLKQPMQAFLCIDRNDLITYSNKINPQQVAEYRQKSHLLPSSATSKKSSAASYDVYEIMDVLVNSNKTSVTITRNANRSAQCPTSIYSHSVNSNTAGIVSTQLHLQAKSYLDSMRKFYAEEHERLQQEQVNMLNEPSEEEEIQRYTKRANLCLSNGLASVVSHKDTLLNSSGDSLASQKQAYLLPNQSADFEQAGHEREQFEQEFWDHGGQQQAAARPSFAMAIQSNGNS